MPKRPTNGNGAFAGIMDREFHRLEIEQGKRGKYRTNRARAEYLQIKEASLSRWLSGERGIKPEAARDIAKRLRSTGSEEEKIALAMELVKAQDFPEEERYDIENWFARYGRPNRLMVVEFREPPAAENEYLRTIIARAVKNGMTYAMCYPYPRDENDNARDQSDNRQLPLDMRNHISKVWTETYSTFWGITQEILRQIFLEEVAQGKSAPERGLYIAALRRLRLFTMRPEEKSRCPALLHRYFYTESRKGDPIDPSAFDEQMWEWLSPQGLHYMTRKHTPPESLQAMRIRFYPMVQYFQNYGHLPPAKADLVSFFASDRNFQASKQIDQDWIVWQLDPGHGRSIDDIVDEFFSKLQTGTTYYENATRPRIS